MPMIRFAAGFAVVVALASCTSAPAATPFDGAYATLEFQDGDYVAGTPNRVQPELAGSYAHHGDDRDYGSRRSVEFLSATGASACEPAARIVKFKTRTRDAQTRIAQFQSGMPIGIVARTESASLTSPMAFGAASASTEIDCRSVAVFTPQTGRTYTIVQNEHRDGRCTIDVRDKATNAAPLNLVIRENISCPSV